jgi:hypothetical protein
MTEGQVSQHVLAVLEPLLGRFTARKALELAAEQCERTLEGLGAGDVACVCERLHPMLRTLLGAATASEVLAAIAAPFTREESLS